MDEVSVVGLETVSKMKCLQKGGDWRFEVCTGDGFPVLGSGSGKCLKIVLRVKGKKWGGVVCILRFFGRSRKKVLDKK